jgi:uncharacterized protein YuzE
MRDLTCRYDPGASAVYIYVGSTEFRIASKTVTLGDGDKVMADIDQDGDVIGVEIMDVNEPVVHVLGGYEPPFTRVETVTPGEEIL